jgi:hypothetical protein
MNDKIFFLITGISGDLPGIFQVKGDLLNGPGLHVCYEERFGELN